MKYYTLAEFKKLDLPKVDTVTKVQKRFGREFKVEYLKDFATFDTEVSTIPAAEVGLLYSWQACVFGIPVHGRYVDEIKELIRHLYIKLNLGFKRRLVIYVHNLEYDYQFFRALFNWKELFAVSKRAILYAYAYGIEWRCSYKMTNLSLEKFTTQMMVEHQKLSGEKFDYRAIRTPDTDLGEHIDYCMYDVMGLYEAIKKKLWQDGDNIVTVPMTSTGYVRRDCRRAMQRNKKNRELFEKMRLSRYLWRWVKDAFRGGNTHANRFWSGVVVENVVSYDMASAYPAVIMYERFASSPYYNIDPPTSSEQLISWINNKEYTYLFTIILENIETKASVPYIPVSKCQYLDQASVVEDNGRVLSCKKVQMRCNEDDLRIILKQYYNPNFRITVTEAVYAETALLPKELRQCVSDYFAKKTELKNVEGQEYFYAKAKALLNSIFGLMCCDPVHYDIDIDDAGEWVSAEPKRDKYDTDEEFVDALISMQEYKLSKFYESQNSFLPYQWGMQVTSKCRARLQEAIDIIDAHANNDAAQSKFVYADTDSCKFIYDKDIMEEIDKINDRIYGYAKASDIPAQAYTKDGELQTLGVWDYETAGYGGGVYRKFRTYGAKKYAVEYDKKGKHIFEVTVAGLNKKKAAKYYENVDNFLLNTTVEDSGRTIAVYDDNIKPHYVNVEGKDYKIYANIAILDTTYTLGVTERYKQIAPNVFEGICYAEVEE